MIEIREGDKQAFFDAPFNAYGRDTPYVTPMWSDVDRYFDASKNPLFKAGNPFRIFAAMRDGRSIGRICAHLHRAGNERHKLNRAYFGFFDVADDAEAADALLNAAMQLAKSQGCAELAGNFNLTAMQQIGVTTDGFDGQPYTDMLYSPPHIHTHLERNGFERFFPNSTFEIDLTTVDANRLLTDKSKATLADPAIKWIPVERKGFAERLEDARIALNAGFDPNPMFVPVTKEEYNFQAGEMMWVLDRRLSTCTHIDGKVAGVILCVPDMNPMLKRLGGKFGLTAPYEFIRNRLTRKRAVVIYYSVMPEYQGRGLNSAMLHRTIEACRAAGYTSLGCTWIADVNIASIKQMERIGAKRLHRQHLFRKAVA
jgi:GNAT superfamily N-acetyltransferase